MSLLTYYLPHGAGMLPYWQMIVSSFAIFNSLQNFYGTSLTKRIYTGKPEQVSPLHARSFAVWTATAAIVRLYCAYHINDKTIYDMTIWTYVLALSHFGSEFLFYRTAKIGPGLLSPLIVAVTSLSWMVAQYDNYVTQ